jgi:hypothetical protein
MSPSGTTKKIAIGDLPYFPLSQTVETVDDSFTDLFSVQSAGGTDTVGPLELVQAGRLVGGILGQTYFFGYNALQGASDSTGANGAATINFWADAGDTNSSGAHGVEINLSWLGPGAGAGGATGAFQFVAVNDETNTVNTNIRCGVGTSGVFSSNITFQNANATVTFAQMRNTGPSVVFFVPTTFTCSTGSNTTLFQTTAAGVPEILQVDGPVRTGGADNSQVRFTVAGTEQWRLHHAAPFLVISDQVNSRTAFTLFPGATPAASKILANSAIQAASSIVTGTAAIATTATDGFLYLPSCPGPPTGTPTVWTGTVPSVIDSTDGRVYYFINGAWKSVTPS